jgi:hypothetical protein
MVDYNRIRGRATKAITKYGTKGTLRQTVTTEGGDNWDVSSSIVETDVNVVIVDYEASDREDGAIQQTDVRALISAEGDPIDVNANYELAIGEDVYNVVRIKPLKPAGLTIMYDAQVRQ